MTSTDPQPVDETQDLALRFMRVLDSMFQVSRHSLAQHQMVRRLPMNHFYALHLVRREPGITQREIAERLQVTAAAISTAVKEMESYGLIQRSKDENDGRVTRLHLSEQGQQMFNDAQAVRCRGIADLLGVLPPEEQRMVVEALERAVVASQENQTKQPS